MSGCRVNNIMFGKNNKSAKYEISRQKFDLEFFLCSLKNSIFFDFWATIAKNRKLFIPNPSRYLKYSNWTITSFNGM